MQMEEFHLTSKVEMKGARLLVRLIESRLLLQDRPHQRFNYMQKLDQIRTSSDLQ